MGNYNSNNVLSKRLIIIILHFFFGSINFSRLKSKTLAKGISLSGSGRITHN